MAEAEEHKAQEAHQLLERPVGQVADGKGGAPHDVHCRLPTYEEIEWDDACASRQTMATGFSATSSRLEISTRVGTTKPEEASYADNIFEDRGAEDDQVVQAQRPPSDTGKDFIVGATSGFARVVRSLALGFGKGFTGIATEPVKGAMQDGVSGFGKGLVRGFLGVVARPAHGARMFATHTWKGIYSSMASGAAQGQRGPVTCGTLWPRRKVQPEASSADTGPIVRDQVSGLRLAGQKILSRGSGLQISRFDNDPGLDSMAPKERESDGACKPDSSKLASQLSRAESGRRPRC